jgi:hypothetical protein
MAANKTRGDHESGEREHQRLTGEVAPPRARRVLRREPDEHVKTDDRRRQHNGQRDERFQKRREARARGVEPMRQRQTDHAQDKRRDRREAQRQRERLPERRSETEERGGGFGQDEATLNAERLTLNAEWQGYFAGRA